MQLSNELNEKIEKLTSHLPLSELVKESEKLTLGYRGKDVDRHFNALSTDNQRLAYLAARFPATYVVVSKVLEEIQKRIQHETIQSVLDVGAGPGTAFLAIAETTFPLKNVTFIERDAGFIALGKRLTSHLDHIEQDWICQDLRKEFNVEPHDLVIASYSLNELMLNDRLELLNKLWKLTKKILVIIEPGTKAAFESLKIMREHMRSQEAHLIAPCPHFNSCPLKENDWCHFAARIERSSLHRKTKLATLNYEDEKFSYMVFSKNKIDPCHARVIRHPYKGSGFVKLQVCYKNGIEEKTITKKNKLHYLQSKKIQWGDEFLV